MMETLTGQIKEEKLNLIFTDERPRDWCWDKHDIL